MQNAKVIDADGHVQDRDAEIRKFMAVAVLPETRTARRQGQMGTAACTASSTVTSHDVPTRLQRYGSEKGSIFRCCFPPAPSASRKSPEKDYAAAFCRGLQRLIANLCKESPRLKGIGLVPFQDVPCRGDRSKSRHHASWKLAGIAIASLRSEGPSRHGVFLADL